MGTKLFNYQRGGFTLIEVLVVIFILGILLTLTIASLANSRAATRDVIRLSDVRQAQSALELYFYNKNSFPAAANIVLGSGDYDVFCDTVAGFQGAEEGCSTIYFKKLPLAPTPPADNSYLYNSTDGKSYIITFTLEKGAGGLAAGQHTATAEGMQ
ncbi:MAG: prepilin-type N-terminal cleavage/methylation domain-containing protein [Patescibacteria group bacterium]